MASLKSKGLGRGLESLIPTNFDPSLLIDSQDRVQKLFIRDILPNPDQPRKHFDEQALNELADSIKRYGVLQPLIVVPSNSKYLIVAGERRWRAAQIAKLDKIPAIIRKQKEIEQLEIALIENVQRVDLSPLEQAVSIEKLHSQFNLSYADIAKRLGKATPTIINIVRLLQLPKDAVEALRNKQITEGHARAILSLKQFPKKQEELLGLILEKKWSVRQAEQFVVATKAGHNEKSKAESRTEAITRETKLVSERLGTNVSIKRTAKGGRLEIHFKTDEDLDRIVKLIDQKLK